MGQEGTFVLRGLMGLGPGLKTLILEHRSPTPGDANQYRSMARQEPGHAAGGNRQESE